MENQVYDRTDIFTFLGDISHKLVKEGDALRALADGWFTEKTEDRQTLTCCGVDVARLGRQLLVLREHLCQPCATKELAEVLSFKNPVAKEDSNPKE
jgi:hypothetical protein